MRKRFKTARVRRCWGTIDTARTAHPAYAPDRRWPVGYVFATRAEAREQTRDFNDGLERGEQWIEAHL